jgi:hypothetical protein
MSTRKSKPTKEHALTDLEKLQQTATNLLGSKAVAALMKDASDRAKKLIDKKKKERSVEEQTEFEEDMTTQALLEVTRERTLQATNYDVTQWGFHKPLIFGAIYNAFVLGGLVVGAGYISKRNAERDEEATTTEALAEGAQTSQPTNPWEATERPSKRASAKTLESAI